MIVSTTAQRAIERLGRARIVKRVGDARPDFPECIDNFGFLRFVYEAAVAGSASWVVAGNAADAIIK